MGSVGAGAVAAGIAAADDRAEVLATVRGSASGGGDDDAFASLATVGAAASATATGAGVGGGAERFDGSATRARRSIGGAGTGVVVAEDDGAGGGGGGASRAWWPLARCSAAWAWSLASELFFT